MASSIHLQIACAQQYSDLQILQLYSVHILSYKNRGEADPLQSHYCCHDTTTTMTFWLIVLQERMCIVLFTLGHSYQPHDKHISSA
ncbi:hypothetical protein GUJ93_ZPchr0010g8484 [Zizania palustris]|uniref:Uncharacterized protein n=1 Tax=Zizania palustris TaxID=103762 RepID=A0A8J5WBY6_ZIZPA|nr:hypothetical protein GUJ93_ZPchr0010g8484 [Zizania palustris]